MARDTSDATQSVNVTLPEYEAPPLFETVFGVRFPRLKGWDMRHFGLFWDQVREDYPRFQAQPPLPGPTLGKGLGGQGGIAVELLTELAVRCWYLIPDETRLLQIQADAFFHNWRKVSLNEVYPRYRTIRPSFEREWTRFRSFLSQWSIPSPEVVECEATYVNHFEQGHEWHSIADLPKVLTWWRHNDLLPQRVRFNASVGVGDHNVDVVLSPAVRRQDKREILQFNLSIKGRPASSDPHDIMAWMDSARAAIVQGFTDLTTSEMHSLWRRTR